MIGKIPAAGRGFKGIVAYLLRGPAGKERHDATAGERTNARTGERPAAKPNRVLWTDTRNLLTPDPEKALRIMRATANRSVRCKSPVYHFVISWSEKERPDFQTMRAIVDQTCRDMGLEDLQRITIAHDDTRHRHVHVVVNRIHPETAKAWNRRQDWVRLERSLANQARMRGIEHVPGRHNDRHAFRDKPRKAPDREYQMARRTGASPPLQKWPHARLIKERPQLVAAFAASNDWHALHAAMSKLGYRLESKGAGLVIRDQTAELKLSRLSKTIRLRVLEDRYQSPFEGTETLTPVRTAETADDQLFPAPELEVPKRDIKTTYPQNTVQHPTDGPRSQVDSDKSAREHAGDNDHAISDADDDDTPNSPRRRRRKFR